MQLKVITIFIILLNSCIVQAQVIIPEDNINISTYPSFYQQTVQKINNIIPNKTNYYGQPLSVFLSSLTQNNIVIKNFQPGPFNNKFVRFGFLWNFQTEEDVLYSDYVQPEIRVFFQQSYNYEQISTMMSTNGYHSYWNPQAENFFKNLIIDKIEFWYVNGLTDKTSPPK